MVVVVITFFCAFVIRETNIPFVVLLTSKIELAFATAPVILMANDCALLTADETIKSNKQNNKCFISVNFITVNMKLVVGWFFTRFGDFNAR